MDNLKEIKKFNSRIEAEIARGYLKSQGINAIILADDGGQMYPSINIVRGIKLMTDPRYLQKARELLEDH